MFVPRRPLLALLLLPALLLAGCEREEAAPAAQAPGAHSAPAKQAPVQPPPAQPPGEWHAVVFMYHRFGEDTYPSTSVRLAQFDAHLEELAHGGYTVWPLERLLEYWRAQRAVPPRTVVITVDDAYRSVYEHAFPRLQARGWPFTVFVATDPVDLGSREYMTWEQMREMRAAGVSFANHSATHDYLVRRRAGESAQAWGTRVSADIERGRQRLEAELGAVPPVFAYPFGEYSAALAALLEDQGYIAFGQHSGALGAHSHPLALPRFAMAEAYAAPDEFRQKALALALPVTRVEPWDPLVAAGERPRLELTLAPSAARLDQLACFVGGQGRVEVQWLDREAGRYAVEVAQPLRAGRARVNCTAPAPQAERFYWFSHQWVVRPADG